MLKSIDFVKRLWEAPIDKIAIENPIGMLSSSWMKPTQIVQPYFFGDEATKSTCLWLKNLPKLEATDMVSKGERFVWTDKKHGKVKSQPMWYYQALRQAKTKQERQSLRSKTFQGIANAMASQWSA
jgi:hypothetical protein